ncbi:hypothetical protein R9D86_000386 [Escherichia coli]|nr:hypothetical protein [Escherichia coli]
MSLKLKEGQKVVVVDYATKTVMAKGEVTEIYTSAAYPIAVRIDNSFVKTCCDEDMPFQSGERLTFNSEYLFRGKHHSSHNDFDLEVLSEEYYNRVYLERVSSTYKYLMDSFLKEAVKVSEDVDKAIALLIPHIKSGKLSVEAVKALIEENL